MQMFLSCFILFVSGILFGKSHYDNTLTKDGELGTAFVAIIFAIIAIAGISSI